MKHCCGIKLGFKKLGDRHMPAKMFLVPLFFVVVMNDERDKIKHEL